jgi:hypothetical protein
MSEGTGPSAGSRCCFPCCGCQCHPAALASVEKERDAERLRFAAEIMRATRREMATLSRTVVEDFIGQLAWVDSPQEVRDMVVMNLRGCSAYLQTRIAALGEGAPPAAPPEPPKCGICGTPWGPSDRCDYCAPAPPVPRTHRGTERAERSPPRWRVSVPGVLDWYRSLRGAPGRPPQPEPSWGTPEPEPTEAARLEQIKARWDHRRHEDHSCGEVACETWRSLLGFIRRKHAPSPADPRADGDAEKADEDRSGRTFCADVATVNGDAGYRDSTRRSPSTSPLVCGSRWSRNVIER